MRTRQVEEIESVDKIGFESGKVYVIIADTSDYSDGFCLAKCKKSYEDHFYGNYLDKISDSEDPSDGSISFRLTSYQGTFFSASVLSFVLFLTEKHNRLYTISQAEINDIIFAVNSLL